MNNITTQKTTRFYTHRWPVVNLKFFQDFLVQKGLSATDFAEQIGVKPHTVRRWLTQDNVPLSRITEAFRELGYDLQFAYKTETDTEAETDSNISITLSEEDMANKTPLDFISKVLLEKKLSVSEFAKRINRTQPGVSKWFRNQDIYVKSIFEIGEKLNWGVSVSIKPIQGTK